MASREQATTSPRSGGRELAHAPAPLPPPPEMDSVLMDRSSPSLEAGAPSGQAGLEGMINEPVRKPSGVVTQKLKNTGSGEEVSHDEGIYASPSETPQRLSAHPEDLRLGVESRLSELKKNNNNNSERAKRPLRTNCARDYCLPDHPGRRQPRATAARGAPHPPWRARSPARGRPGSTEGRRGFRIRRLRAGPQG